MADGFQAAVNECNPRNTFMFDPTFCWIASDRGIAIIEGLVTALAADTEHHAMYAEEYGDESDIARDWRHIKATWEARQRELRQSLVKKKSAGRFENLRSTWHAHVDEVHEIVNVFYTRSSQPSGECPVTAEIVKQHLRRAGPGQHADVEQVSHLDVASFEFESDKYSNGLGIRNQRMLDVHGEEIDRRGPGLTDRVFLQRLDDTLLFYTIDVEPKMSAIANFNHGM